MAALHDRFAGAGVDLAAAEGREHNAFAAALADAEAEICASFGEAAAEIEREKAELVAEKTDVARLFESEQARLSGEIFAADLALDAAYRAATPDLRKRVEERSAANRRTIQALTASREQLRRKLEAEKANLDQRFHALRQSLSDRQQQAPQLLAQLRQQNAQRRRKLPGLVATWKNAATERETRLHDELEAWKTKHPILSGAVPSWDDLSASLQQLSNYAQSLNDWSQHLQQRKRHLASAEQTMQAEWQCVSAKPGLSMLPSAGQRQDWLRKSLPLRLIWRDLLPLMQRCALLKAELLTSGFLDAEAYPEIDLAWAAVEF